MGICKGFWMSGYNVLLFDYRSHTRIKTKTDTDSHDSYWKCYRSTVGYLETIDAQAALDYLKSLKKDLKVGVIGPSMGGSIALNLSSKEENKDFIVGVISDCAFSNLRSILENSVDKLFPTKIAFKTTDYLPLHTVLVDSICKLCFLLYNYGKTFC